MIALVIALAGGVGAALRAWVDAAFPHGPEHRVPVGTVVINLSGSLAIGLIVGAGAGFAPGPWQQVLTIGFLGGYTTFSTAAVQTAQMILAREWPQALIYGGGLVIGASAFAALGLWAGSGLAGAL